MAENWCCPIAYGKFPLHPPPPPPPPDNEQEFYKASPLGDHQFKGMGRKRKKPANKFSKTTYFNTVC